MPRMVIPPEDIMNASTTIKNCQATQESIISGIDTIVNEMFAEWEGQAKLNFAAKFDDVKPTYQSFVPDLEKFAEFLRVYSLTNEQLDMGGGR